jgi:hypothetical protein
MSFDPHPRPFEPRWLFPAIETDEEEPSREPGLFPFSPDEESTNDPAGPDFDEALQQIASEGCCVSSLRGDRCARWIRDELRTIPPGLTRGLPPPRIHPGRLGDALS